jgi:hypothetical protein
MARIFTDLRIHQTGFKIVSITLLLIRASPFHPWFNFGLRVERAIGPEDREMEDFQFERTDFKKLELTEMHRSSLGIHRSSHFSGGGDLTFVSS